MRRLIDLFLVFGPAQDPAKVVREALSRALVYYYPVAGRFAVPDSDEHAVACTGDGIWFVEASADCSLKDVNKLERPFMIPKEELIPCPPPQVKQDDVFLMLQVFEMGELREDPMEGPRMVPLEYGSFCVTDWSQGGFYEVDFGWGGPIQVAPLTEDDLIPLHLAPVPCTQARRAVAVAMPPQGTLGSIPLSNDELGLAIYIS